MMKITSSIKAKLQLSFLTFILLSAIAGIFSYNILSTIVAQEEVKSKIDQMVSHFTEVRKQEKDFILYERKELPFLESGSCESLQKHAKAIMEIKQLIRQIKESGQIEGYEKGYLEIQTIKAAIEAYGRSFAQMVRKYKIRGFKDHGLEGAMREVVHELQKCESKEEQWFALMLRRHEKDFFIRQDPKYIETLQKRALEFIGFVKTAQLPHTSQEYREKTIASIKNYVSQFNRIASIEKEIGLTKKQGIIGALKEQAETTESLLENVQQMIYEKTQKLVGDSISIMLVSGLLMLACGVFFSLFIAKKISNPIIHLSKLVENASIGDDSTSRSLQAMERNDELGKLVKSFSNMFREINLKIKEISAKNAGLQLATQKEKERAWFTEGVSLFEGIMSRQANDLDQLCDDFLFQLVKYTQSSQAALFLKGSDEKGVPHMQLHSCYAHDKKRYVKSSIEMGEGLVGAVWQEKDDFYMTDIPENYSKIRSGLGQAKPTAVFILPAVSDGEVEAIVEMGAFSEYSENEKALIRQVCKGLAGAVSRACLQKRTQILLDQSNTLTVELKQNEEEMKQHLEELYSTQEEMEKGKQRMQQKIDRLQNSLSVLSNFIDPSYKSFLITDEKFNLIYLNKYWQDLFGETEASEGQKINNLLNLSEQELNVALQNQHEFLLKQLNRKMFLPLAGEKAAFTDIKVAEHRTDHKVFYSILAN